LMSWIGISNPDDDDDDQLKQGMYVARDPSILRHSHKKKSGSITERVP
jgi:hypothetical protein